VLEPIINSKSSIINMDGPPSTLVNFSLQLSSALYKSPPFAQNKPNSQNPKTNATLVTAKNYKQKPPHSHPKKQTQTNPIPPARRETIRHRDSSIQNLGSKWKSRHVGEASCLTYHAITPSIMQNKPNSQNEEPTATSYATKIYVNTPLRPTEKNKPNQTQLCRGAAPSEVADAPWWAGYPRPKVAAPANYLYEASMPLNSDVASSGHLMYNIPSGIKGFSNSPTVSY